ncbi:hypothetical protein ACFO0N_10520 [Halobium salinum]|uniref:DUF1059 domain-containing protein n=1 Tax=Halobium salinum TaxID=1364940 RepID=A0ABD5PCD3_9EURY|nr:hypothetical protein [Halobium salinum]
MGQYAYTCVDCRWAVAFDGGCEQSVLDAALGHFEQTGHTVERADEDAADAVNATTEAKTPVDDTADS